MPEVVVKTVSVLVARSLLLVTTCFLGFRVKDSKGSSTRHCLLTQVRWLSLALVFRCFVCHGLGFLDRFDELLFEFDSEP
jgi:hypothetical protein